MLDLVSYECFELKSRGMLLIYFVFYRPTVISRWRAPRNGVSAPRSSALPSQYYGADRPNGDVVGEGPKQH